MKPLNLCLFLLLLPLLAMSQYTNTVHLKNGSVVKGRITEIKPGEFVRCVTADKNNWVFAMAEIEKIEMATNAWQAADSIQKGHLLCDIGFLAGTVENEMKAPLSFLTGWHYNVYKGLHLGVASGFEFFQMTYIPLLADIRYKPRASGVSVYVQAGLGMPINNEGQLNGDNYRFRRGIIINPGLSYTFNTKEREAFTISIGYRYQETNADRISSENNWYYPRNYSLITRLNRFNLRFGYIFR